MNNLGRLRLRWERLIFLGKDEVTSSILVNGSSFLTL
jgi:hypothetical protein